MNLTPLTYPVVMTFKLIALAPQITIRDATGRELLYVRQKLLKLKEEVNIFASSAQTERLYGIRADRILDWSARYHITADNGRAVGSVKRQGMRSLWRATYEVWNGEQVEFHVSEESPFVRLMDSLFGELPLIGIFSGYFFNPIYLVSRREGTRPVMRMTKRPSFMERNFYVEKEDPGLTPEEEERLLLSLFMVTLLERARG